MSEATPFPPRLILAAAVTSGVLLALAIYTVGQRFGLDLGSLWRSDGADLIPASAAIAWWLVALVAFVGGHTAAMLMERAVSGRVPPLLRQFLIVVVVLVLAAAGQAASGPSAIPTVAGVVSGLIALGLGAAMAFCGAQFALSRS
ncbi:MAG: hypothetical protein ACLP1D_19810 [Xanthobacteraceae bacterium]|jgi:hypothetical protein